MDIYIYIYILTTRGKSKIYNERKIYNSKQFQKSEGGLQGFPWLTHERTNKGRTKDRHMDRQPYVLYRLGWSSSSSYEGIQPLAKACCCPLGQNKSFFLPISFVFEVLVPKRLFFRPKQKKKLYVSPYYLTLTLNIYNFTLISNKDYLSSSNSMLFKHWIYIKDISLFGSIQHWKWCPKLLLLNAMQFKAQHHNLLFYLQHTYCVRWTKLNIVTDMVQ